MSISLAASAPPDVPGTACEERFYEDGMPAFVEAALERLYATPMTTLLRFSQVYCLRAATTYVARSGAGITAVIVFRRERGRLVVYNEQIAISSAELLRFARAAFARYPELGVICWYAIDARSTPLGYPCHQLGCLEDISFALPARPALYVAMLGKNMAEKIRRFDRKLSADFGDVRKRFESGAQVPVATIRTIIGFSTERMAGKRQRSYHSEALTLRTIALVRRYGVVGTVSVDGALCAGIIMLRIGGSCSMMILAHDPRYDRYNLGTLCCYYGISHAIEQGAARFDFGWGRFDYKYRMAGRLTELVRLDLYRSRGAMLRALPLLCQRSLAAWRRSVKLWLARPASEGNRLARGVRRSLAVARRLRAQWTR